MKAWNLVAKKFLVDMWWLAIVNHGSVTSGCRTPQRNRAKGGATMSKHRIALGGLAVDFVFRSKAGREAARAKATSMGYFPHVGSDYGPHRLHVQAIQKGVDPRDVLNAIPKQEAT